MTKYQVSTILQSHAVNREIIPNFITIWPVIVQMQKTPLLMEQKIMGKNYRDRVVEYTVFLLTSHYFKTTEQNESC